MPSISPIGSNSALGYALEGMRHASKQLEGAADEALRSTAHTSDSAAGQSSNPPSLERAAVTTMTASTAYTANAKMVQSVNEMLGSLMDIVA